MKEYSKIWKNIIKISYYIMLSAILIFFAAHKIDMHIDEMFSYGLSNTHIAFDIIDGYKYEPADVPYMEYLVVKDDARFDYKNVWQNQADDTHPPLYYAILHTICSFFPGKFSMWYGEVINIVASLGILYFVRKLIKVLVNDERILMILTLGYIFSSGFIAHTFFLRMYVLASLWITIFTYYAVSFWNKREKKSLIWMALSIYLGAMTHYYCIIYSVLIVIMLGLLSIKEKQYKHVMYLVLIGIGTGALSIISFPAMLNHLFKTGHGAEGFNNLTKFNISEIIERLKFFGEVIDYTVFGSIGIVLIVFITLVLLYLLLIQKCNIGKKDTWLILIVPSIVWFIIVAISATYYMPRYVSSVTPVVYAYFFAGIVNVMQKINRKKALYIVTFFIVFIVTIAGWINKHNSKWEYLFRHISRDKIEKAEQYSDKDCFVIYDKNGLPNLNYWEIKHYKSVTFIEIGDIEKYKILFETKEDGFVISGAEIPEDGYEKYLMELTGKDKFDYIGQKNYKSYFCQ